MSKFQFSNCHVFVKITNLLHKTNKLGNCIFLYLQCFSRYRGVQYLILNLKTNYSDHLRCFLALQEKVSVQKTQLLLAQSFFLSSKVFNTSMCIVSVLWSCYQVIWSCVELLTRYVVTWSRSQQWHWHCHEHVECGTPDLTLKALTRCITAVPTTNCLRNILNLHFKNRKKIVIYFFMY